MISKLHNMADSQFLLERMSGHVRAVNNTPNGFINVFQYKSISLHVMCENSANLKVFPPIYRFGNAGRWIRTKFFAGILHGTPVLLHIQNLRTPRLNLIMKAVSFLGEEEFYTPLVAAILWLVDAKLGRLVAMLMALGFYVAGSTKNLLCLPRPPLPVIPLERCNDWALPSHHAVLSVNVPWYLWFYVYLHSSNVSPPVLVFLFFLTAMWSFLVMFSRMYLGVHSPADIVVGGILGCLLLAAWLRWDLYIDWFIVSSATSSFVVLTIIVVLLYIHPDPYPTTYVFSETVCMVGVASGIVLGRAYSASSINLTLMESRYSYNSNITLLTCGLVRLFVGLALLVAFRMVAAFLCNKILSFVCQLIGLEVVCVKRRSLVTSEKVHYSTSFIVLDQDETHEVLRHQTVLNMDIPIKFLSYLSMGFAAVNVMPTIFHMLNI